MSLKYKRVLLKISGEALMGKQSFGIDPSTISRISKEIETVVQMGVEVCIVVGGGNIFRGISAQEVGIERTTGDYMGMLATVMNALAMQNALELIGITTRVQSAFPISSVCETYIRRRAERHLEKGRVIIFAAGTGNPYFTTDTAAALRASEMNCNAMFKATNVDGVYSSDPKKNKDAKRYKELKYMEVLGQDLKVMDAAAVSLARENNVPVIVFSIHEKGAFSNVVSGNGDFTIIK
jgi:uridylate kinase